MGKTPDLGREAEALRELVREANGTIKDLRAATKEAREAGPAIVKEYLEKAVADGLAEYGETIQKAMAAAVAKVNAEFDKLSDILMGRTADDKAQDKKSIPELVHRLGAARLAPTPADTPPDDGLGAFPCPRCGAHLDTHEHMASLAKPIGEAEGDADGFTVCAPCGQVIILTSGGPRRPTGAEDAAIRRTPEFRKVETFRSVLDVGPDGLKEIRGLIERSSPGTPDARTGSQVERFTTRVDGRA